MKRTLCYVNPTVLLRRPISELLALQKGKRGLLIPEKGAEQHLHHASLFKNVTFHTYPSWQPPGPFEWPLPGPSFLTQAWRVLKTYDTIHLWAHFYPTTLLFLLISLLFPRRKIILTIDTLPGYSFNAGPLLNTAFKLWTWTVGRIVYAIPDTITLYGTALLPYAKKSGINLQKVKVIPTGIIAHKLPPRRNARKKIREELQIEEEHIVLYAGLLNPRKRVADVLAVARHLTNTRFLIAGDGPSRKKLERQAPPNTTFLGWRKDLLTLMRGADVFLFPSSAEGLPGVVMEAMYCETPVITTRIPCTTDLITHRKEGLLCNVGDVEGFVKATRELLTTRTAQRLAKNAKEKIKKYSWKNVMKAYEELYD